MSPSRILRLMDPCLEALGMAHQRKVIHKDLKPPNLFLRHARTERESLCILDFGIARIQDDQQLTMANQFTGTPQYFAPEYASLQDATPAVDVYQMGLILVEMWTGKPVIPPVQPVACALLHTQGMLDIPRSLLEGPMGPILARALALDPAQRFPDAQALRKALATVDPARLRPVREGEPTISLKEAAPHRTPYPLQAFAAAQAASHQDATEVGVPAMPQTDAFERGALSQAIDAAKARQASPSAAFAPTQDGVAPFAAAATQANPATPRGPRLVWLVVAAAVSILGVIGAAAVALSMLPDDDNDDKGAQAQAQPDPTPEAQPDPTPDPTPKGEPDAGAPEPDPKLVALDPPDAGAQADAGVAQADAGGPPAEDDAGGAPSEGDAGAASKGGEEPAQGGDPTPKSGRDKGGKAGRDKPPKADDKTPKADDKTPKPNDKPKADDKGGGKAMPLIPVDPE
jgi:serine/threonine-protein kinase